MNYYIADTHFGHKNILRLDGRPWDDVDSMEADMVALWNARVTDDDDVYILGDFCGYSEEHWLRLLQSLNGRKHVIIGNHDPKEFSDAVLELLAEPPKRMMGIRDGGYEVVLCHYPVPIYRHDYDPNVVMLYGHVHSTFEDEALKAGISAMKDHIRMNNPDYAYQGNLHNVWCGYYGYAPATLQEILQDPS